MINVQIFCKFTVYIYVFKISIFSVFSSVMANKEMTYVPYSLFPYLARCDAGPCRMMTHIRYYNMNEIESNYLVRICRSEIKSFQILKTHTNLFFPLSTKDILAMPTNFSGLLLSPQK